MAERDREPFRRRRRLATAGALLVVVAAVVAVIASGGNGGGSGEAQVKAATDEAGRSKAHGGDAGGKVRNATPQSDWSPYTGPVPILEYHVLGRPKTEVPYPELYVPRAAFRKQMDWLDRQGYEAVTLERVEDAWYRGGTMPSKPIVISFDDGYRPQYTFALPQLRKHGWPGL